MVTDTSSQKNNVTALISNAEKMGTHLDDIPIRSEKSQADTVSRAGSTFKKRSLSIIPRKVDMTPRKKSPTRSVAGDFDQKSKISMTEARTRLNRDNLNSLNGDEN